MELRIQASPLTPVKVPDFTGHVVRALFLNMVRLVSPEAAERLHGAADHKPYLVTPMHFKASGKVDEGFVLAPNSTCFFSLRLLDGSYTRHLVGYFMRRSSLEVCGGVLKVCSVHVSFKSYEEFYSEASEARAFILNEFSPIHEVDWEDNTLNVHRHVTCRMASMGAKLEAWEAEAIIYMAYIYHDSGKVIEPFQSMIRKGCGAPGHEAQSAYLAAVVLKRWYELLEDVNVGIHLLQYFFTWVHYDTILRASPYWREESSTLSS